MFVGREHELASLERLYEQNGFQMVVLYGRRRVGKTALAARFAEGKPTLSFTAKVQSDALNLGEFSAKVYAFFGLPASTGAFASWEDALTFVADRAEGRRILFVFDEFPYAAQRNMSLLSVLQAVIDHAYSSTNIFLILSGSNQGFMEDNLLGGRSSHASLGEKNPLYGRRTSQIHLQPFGYRDAARMLSGASPEELVSYYAVFGGTPYYLSAVDAGGGIADNVERLFFAKEGLLYEEPLMLLRQELREPAMYSSILDAVANGASRMQEIADKTGEQRTSMTRYLDVLSSMGLVRKRVPFGQSRAHSRKGVYRIADPAFAFWYRFVQPNLDAVELDAGELVARDIFAGEALPTYVGRWFEEVCLQWTVAQAKDGTLPVPATAFGSWWGADPTEHQQADVDVVASNERKRLLFAGECKWRNSFDETEAIRKLQHRAALIGDYRQTSYALFSKRPVSRATRDKLGGSWLLVTADDLYR